MKKLISLIIISIAFANFLKSQDFECVSCYENDVDFTKFASGIGYYNVSTGMYSFAGGQRSIASGDYSFAFGRSAFARDLSTIAIGDNVNASWMYSIAIGRNLECRGTHAVAIGFDNQSLAGQTYTFGRNLIAGSSHSMVLGVGSSNKLLNPVPNSLMIGFFSDKPTFFVEESPDDGLTGRIGIGNVTAPLAKLHILGDDDADRPDNASIFIESAGDYYSTVWLGDQNHFLKTKPDHAFELNAGGNDFYFNGGNVGIGLTPDPDHKLDVDGDINFTGSLKQNGEIFETTKWTENADGNLFFNGGNVGIGTSTPQGRLSLQSQAGENVGISYNNGGSAIYWTGNNATTNAFILGGTGGALPETGAINIQGGNVGIGMLPTSNKALEINGDINLTGDLYKQGILMDFTPWEENGNDLHYDAGKVGIGTGTNDPEANLHIYDPDPVGSDHKAHLKIESEIGSFGGSTTLGRLYGSGLLIEQKAAQNTATKLWFRQCANNDEESGISISTYTTSDGNVEYGDIFCESSWMAVRAEENLHLRSNNGNLYLETVGGGKQVQLNEYGQLGIGTTTHIDQGETKLTVNGRIHAKEVKVTAGAGDGADFVFEDDYDLPEITDVEAFIHANKHLPDIPSAKQMQEEGLDIGEMQIKLLQKIEELTLYVIDLKKENEEMQEEIDKLKME